MRRLDAEQPERGKRRRLEFLVGEDFGVGRMIDRVQLDLIEIGDLAQFFGDADFVAAVVLAAARRRGSARTLRDPPGR